MKKFLLFLITLLNIGTAYSQTVPVAYYPFNGNANDESGNGNNGTNYGATLTMDRFGNANSAYSFNGTSSYVKVPNSSTLLPMQASYTFTGWFRLISKRNGNSIYLFSMEDGGSDYSGVSMFYDTTAQSLRFYYHYDDVWSHATIAYAPLVLNEWHQITTTLDRAALTAKIYVDGVLINTYSTDNNNITANSDLCFGKRLSNYHPTDALFTGDQDDIRIYNRALTQGEIDSLYHENGWDQINNNDGLVAYYPFNGDANDLSGNKSHGTINGATLTTDRFGNSNSAFYFDGSSSITATSSLLPNYNRTISLWFNADQTNYRPLLFAYGGNNACGGSFMMNLNVITRGNSYNVLGHYSCDVTYPNSVNPFGNWNHWVVTQSDSGTTFFINGRIVYRDPSGITTYTIPGKLVLGTGISLDGLSPYSDGNADALKGSLDDIRIYDRALTQAGVDSLYHEGYYNPISIALTYPNGGETFIAGTTDTIKWTGSSVDFVKLEYTTDDGATWDFIDSNVPAPAGNGIYLWTVPFTPTTQAKVRVTNLTDNRFVTSAAPFRIIDLRHFVPVWSGNPYQAMNIFITDASLNGLPLEYGDEIGIFDDTVCVGSVTMHETGKLIEIKAASDDPLTPEIDGFVTGDPLVYKLWESSNSSEISRVIAAYNPVSPVPVFSPLGTAFVSLAFQNLLLLSPNGGETFIAGKNDTIKWISEGLTNVDLKYSTDNGTTWISILETPVTANTGSYVWTIPKTPSTNCKVRVSDGTDRLFADTSDNVFSIILPQITVLKPNGGESFVVGKTDTIKWTSSNVANVKLEYTNNGSNWISILNSTPANAGSFVWTIPNTPSTNCRVRISDVTDNSFSDVSDNIFSIILPQITVLKPNGGENFIVGKTDTIKWTSSNVANVKLEYSTDNGSNWISILASTPASAGSFVWTIPNTPTVSCKVKISDAANSFFADTSDNVFSIIKPTVTILKPNGGEQWRIGTTQKITWTSSDVGKVKIQYSTDDGTNWIVLADSASASLGSFDWLIPSPPTTQAKIRIADYKDGSVASQSASPFTIYFPTVTLISPNGGEFWQIGSQQTITWNSTHLTKVKLEYTTDGTTWKLIADQLEANLNSHTLTVPNDSSQKARVRITDAVENLVSDTSNGTFNIYKQAITITSPAGGERYKLGTQQTITWKRDWVNKVKIEFSNDNASTWSVLSGADSVLASLGTFNWTPNVETKQARIRLSDSKDPSLLRMSNAFEIFVPKVTVIAPNGGELWQIGSQKTITWNSTDLTKVKLEYTPDGTTWKPIADQLDANLNSYLWTIPNDPSTIAKVRISDALENLGNDVSDGTFTIYQQKLTLTSPIGEERYRLGSTQNITWTSEFVNKVKIEFSSNNGTSWGVLSDSLLSSIGSFPWVPNVETKQAKIKISDSKNSLLERVGGAFEIFVPKVTILKPNGGENFIVGKTDTIKWFSSDIVDVKLDYSTDNGANWISILNSTPANTGSYLWTIPSTPSTTCKVKISDVSNSEISAVSSSFNIIKPVITLSSPNGGENWLMQSDKQVTWTNTNVDSVKIEFSSDNGVSWNVIALKVFAANASYTWNVTSLPTTQALVRVSQVSDASVQDVSDQVFTIYKEALTVTSPNGGERLRTKSIVQITWNILDIVNPKARKINSGEDLSVANGPIQNVKIEYTSDNGSSWNGIINSINASAKSYEWNVPFIESKNCKIRVVDVDDVTHADTSDGVFEIYNPNLTITSPNGGEIWQANTNKQISWSSSNINDVRIDYSVNNGLTWETISFGIQSSLGNFEWIVPATRTPEAKVRILDISDTTVGDTSDNVFRIVTPSLSLTSPIGGEVWKTNSIQQIKWNSLDVENIKIEYSTDNGNAWSFVNNLIPAAQGLYDWTVPDTPSKNCILRISDEVNPETKAVSPIFSIIKPVVTLLSPNGGEKWLMQFDKQITWTNTDVDSIKIEFSSDNGTSWNIIAPKVFAWDASYTWNVNTLPTSQAIIRVSQISDASVQDVSDNVFTVYKEALAVISPNGSERLRAKSTVQITWNISDITNPKARRINSGEDLSVANAPIQNVKIEYTSDNGTNWNNVINTIGAAVKSYNWEIPVIESKNCKIRIVDVDDNAHADTSDGVFEIYNPKLTVTSPNGGEIWRTNTTNKITWTSSEINEVKIEYSTNDGFSWKVISNSLAASLGSIDWIIPAERTSRAKVRVTDISFASTSDTCDNTFTILFPEISLTAPVGGENWKTNTVQQIKWSSSDIENISIEYSTDNGTSWFLINNSILASSGIYNWTIPRTPTDQAKVRVSDVNYKEINAVSNTFTIIKPLALLTPRGGEKWFSGSVQQVNWNFNFVDSVKLEYSLNNGASWQLIANSLPATLLVYDWHIPPNINSTQCRVKITDRNNIFTADSSGDVFTIIDPTLTVLTPNGGENLKGDTEYQITWKNQNSDSLAIDYSTNNGTTWTLITKACNAKAEKFTWVIPKVTSTQCLMRITDKNYLTVSDTSDEVFSIYTPQITLLSPKGGEIWYVGETKQIKWQSSFVEKVKIELTTTNGNVWSTLASAVNAADSSYTLFIENIPSVACRIKVSADEDSKIVDSSRSNFSIVILPPSIQVSIYQNPVLTQYCNVVLVSDSLLSALPTTEVWRIGDTEIPVYEMKPIPNSVYVYECSIRFDTTGIYNVASKIISRMGIERDTVRQFSVGMILPNLFASIKSKDGGLTLSINPGVVEEITFISVEEEKVNKEIIYRLQPEKTFKKAINLKLSFANASFEETYKLSIFTFVDGEWRAIPSEVNVKEKTVSASLTTFGKVKLGIDVNKKEKIDLPQTFALIQNYPNPFNPSTVITFHLPEDCDASLEIYNMLGAKISTLRSGFALAGRYSVTWEGLNDAKIQVPSGIYLYRLKTNKFDQVRKMIFLK